MFPNKELKTFDDDVFVFVFLKNMFPFEIGSSEEVEVIYHEDHKFYHIVTDEN